MCLAKVLTWGQKARFGTFLALAYPAIERLGLASLAAFHPSTAAVIFLRLSPTDQFILVLYAPRTRAHFTPQH